MTSILMALRKNHEVRTDTPLNQCVRHCVEQKLFEFQMKFEETNFIFPSPTKACERMSLMIVASLHTRVKIIKRSEGRSVVSAAAYRSGEKIKNEYNGETANYTKKEGVVYKHVALPAHAPKKYRNRSVLWNSVEKAETHGNAQLAREFEFALPAEFGLEDHKKLVLNFVTENFVSRGMCADVVIHDKNDGNPHAHVLLTMRPVGADGSWGQKSKKEYVLDKDGNRIRLKSGAYKSRKIEATDWNDRNNALKWRNDLAARINLQYETKGVDKRIDPRSYEEQGLTTEPTKHLGKDAAELEKRGIETEIGNQNRVIVRKNRIMRTLNNDKTSPQQVRRMQSEIAGFESKRASILQFEEQIVLLSEKLQTLGPLAFREKFRINGRIAWLKDSKDRAVADLEHAGLDELREKLVEATASPPTHEIAQVEYRSPNAEPDIRRQTGPNRRNNLKDRGR